MAREMVNLDVPGFVTLCYSVIHLWITLFRKYAFLIELKMCKAKRQQLLNQKITQLAQM